MFDKYYVLNKHMERIDKSVITTAKDVEAMKLIQAYADFLKRSGKIELPKMHDIMRTRVFSDYIPLDEDWYYIRCAAIARHLYMRPCVGINSLREHFGGKHRNGVRHAYHDHANGTIIRSAIHNLEKMGLVEEAKNGGRKLTKAGQKELDLIARQI
ncbi:ribosomal protein S19 [Blastocystis sp. subtype 4]|uniref:ribosomal protein S19 n=2 Tax=Blastocystis sp. subtype 4 TaxID=944170 RepID=UPI00071133AD|nr:ribosomal protein S19 [Blastocystis sp. subtype 4]KNB42987.1 ribosomal protein S19 [Blastocystis sp. subtype 4]|eukprot:XP_014526430.1 ribosomal protein S19 [Blastocystis sp. subtype 4]